MVCREVEVAGDENRGRRVFAKNSINHRSRPPVQDNKLRSRLQAQLTKFTLELGQTLSRPQQKFVGQMLFGIQASQDVKLSNIARSLQEEIPLIKTEDCLSRQLKAKPLETKLTTARDGVRLARSRGGPHGPGSAASSQGESATR